MLVLQLSHEPITSDTSPMSYLHKPVTPAATVTPASLGVTALVGGPLSLHPLVWLSSLVTNRIQRNHRSIYTATSVLSRFRKTWTIYMPKIICSPLSSGSIVSPPDRAYSNKNNIIVGGMATFPSSPAREWEPSYLNTESTRCAPTYWSEKGVLFPFLHLWSELKWPVQMNPKIKGK